LRVAGSGNTPNVIALLRSRWVLFTVVAPLTAWLLSAVAARIEERRGASSLTRAMRWPRERRRAGRAPAPA
jgi:hypothetical protein